MMTTVRTSSRQAYEAWQTAKGTAALAAINHQTYHNKATKEALQRAQLAEQAALEEYSASRLAKFAHVLGAPAPRKGISDRVFLALAILLIVGCAIVGLFQ